MDEHDRNNFLDNTFARRGPYQNTGMYRHMKHPLAGMRASRSTVEAGNVSMRRPAVAVTVSLDSGAILFRAFLETARVWGWVAFVLRKTRGQAVDETSAAETTSRSPLMRYTVTGVERESE